MRDWLRSALRRPEFGIVVLGWLRRRLRTFRLDSGPDGPPGPCAWCIGHGHRLASVALEAGPRDAGEVGQGHDRREALAARGELAGTQPRGHALALGVVSVAADVAARLVGEVCALGLEARDGEQRAELGRRSHQELEYGHDVASVVSQPHAQAGRAEGAIGIGSAAALVRYSHLGVASGSNRWCG